MVYETKSKKYKQMLAVLATLAGMDYNPEKPSAQRMTMHRAGRLVWKIYWSLEVRNEAKKAGPGVWRYRLEVTPELRVVKTNAKLDISSVSKELRKSARIALGFIKRKGPFFKGISAKSIKQFENGKGMLWAQIEHWQKYYSTVKRLTKDDFYTTVENELPKEFKELIAKQK